MRDEIRIARELGRRYAAAASTKFPLGMTERAIDAAWRESVKSAPELAPFKEQFVRGVRGAAWQQEGA